MIRRRRKRDTLYTRVSSARPFFSRRWILHTGCCADRYATCGAQTASGRSVFARAEIPVGLSPCHLARCRNIPATAKLQSRTVRACRHGYARVGCCENTSFYLECKREGILKSFVFFFLPIIFQISIFLIAFIDLEILFHNKWQCKVNLYYNRS